MTRRLPQSTAYTVVFKVFLASDHVTPATGKTVVITLSKAGAAFGNPAAGASNATEIANGWYKFALGTGDTNTLGDLVLVGTAAACDSADIVMMVVSATTGGATNLNAQITSRLAPTVAGRTLDVSGTGEAGIDWANIGTPESYNDFSNTAFHAVGSVFNSVGGDVAGRVGGIVQMGQDEIADTILDRDMSLGTDSGSATVRTVRQALRPLRNKWTVTSGAYQVMKEDDVTVSWESTLSSTPGANPITGSDPA